MARLIKTNSPNRKIFAATMWDDGLVGDFRLMDMLRDVGATAAFALNPARYGDTRKPNTNQPCYGEIVSRSELKEYADFEIVNHTANHRDLTRATLQVAEKEISDGRKMLEDIFHRDVNGFSYPYGRHNDKIADILRRHLYLYGRTCMHTDRVKNEDVFKMHATAKWDNQHYDDLLWRAWEHRDGMVFWGHSYELKSEKDWDKVRVLYEWLVNDPRIRLVTFKELAVGMGKLPLQPH